VEGIIKLKISSITVSDYKDGWYVSWVTIYSVVQSTTGSFNLRNSVYQYWYKLQMVWYLISSLCFSSSLQMKWRRQKVKQGYVVSDFHSVLNQMVYIYQETFGGKEKEWRWAEVCCSQSAM